VDGRTAVRPLGPRRREPSHGALADDGALERGERPDHLEDQQPPAAPAGVQSESR
jgi:hypothetical protein